MASAACVDGPASTLAPAGRDAGDIAQLFWWMCGAALLIWVAMLVLMFICTRDTASPGYGRLLIVGGGVVLPTGTLALLLAVALPRLPALIDGPDDGSDATLRVHVSGEQWWWRVRYERPGAPTVELANELRLPTSRTTHVTLSSDNVIHSFWIPSLAGKVDMIPGRTTYLTLEPELPGTFRGVCAEYCGTSHSHMAFVVVVNQGATFDAWLEGQGADAQGDDSPDARAGRAAFMESGCAGCHTIRGTDATGRIGPDLTHLADRHTLAAATLANDAPSLAAWIRHPARSKPGALMPPFAALGDDRVRAIASYLRGLR
jgi:cytochrome c oxidase subunit 2